MPRLDRACWLIDSFLHSYLDGTHRTNYQTLPAESVLKGLLQGLVQASNGTASDARQPTLLLAYIGQQVLFSSMFPSCDFTLTDIALARCYTDCAWLRSIRALTEELRAT